VRSRPCCYVHPKAHVCFSVRGFSGTEGFLRTLIAKLESDLAITTASLGALRIDPGLRTRVADTLVPTANAKIKVRGAIGQCHWPLNTLQQDLLYVILLANTRVITLARPRKHSIHPGGPPSPPFLSRVPATPKLLTLAPRPADLHVLLNTVCAPSVRDSAASWLPICLPKFNANGFLHAYVTFMRPEAELGLVLVSGGGAEAFDKVRDWCETVTKVRRLSRPLR